MFDLVLLLKEPIWQKQEVIDFTREFYYNENRRIMKKARLLIVDDEEIVRSSLSDWLKEDGYEILAV